MQLRAASAALLSAGALLLGPVLAAPAQASHDRARRGRVVPDRGYQRPRPPRTWRRHARHQCCRAEPDRAGDRLAARRSWRQPKRGRLTGGKVPVYVHVMAGKTGAGNVTASQITQQIAVLNKNYAGGESTAAANTGFTFTLAGTDRFFNDTWHKDRQSTTYRAQTRKGGANALNIWIVDFAYLGIATFPWDTPATRRSTASGCSTPRCRAARRRTSTSARPPRTRPGTGSGSTTRSRAAARRRNDEVSDTPAQSSPTSGCPVGRNSCSLPGLDPIRNYMDYSYDTCYRMFTSGQSARMSQMFAAYRGSTQPAAGSGEISGLPGTTALPAHVCQLVAAAPHARPCVPGKFSGLPPKRS